MVGASGDEKGDGAGEKEGNDADNDEEHVSFHSFFDFVFKGGTGDRINVNRRLFVVIHFLGHGHKIIFPI